MYVCMYECMYVCVYACIEQQHLRDEVGAWQNNRKHRLSRRLLVSEAQIDNRQMSTVNCNSTSKDHGIAAWWTCQATAASAVIELPLKASNRRIVATDCTETVLICHERDLFFCRSRGRVQPRRSGCDMAWLRTLAAVYAQSIQRLDILLRHAASIITPLTCSEQHTQFCLIQSIKVD